ncbi:DUF3850 domain-containing protein [Pseudomonas asiatica]|uniref:DUF3850 domain-containing protein n=1 Tax=Pseudomonas asiatica TaxID=2219225 RepID=UPI001C2BC6E4|nr:MULTISPECIES: DUF3850 domain-containing protein [Pseudomonas]
MPTENRSSNTEMVSVPREHELKIRQTPLADLLSGLKTGEIRDCSDREFAVGDTVLLREIDDARDYTGTVLRRTITHVQKHYGLPDHLCVLSYGQPAPQPHPEPIAWMVGTAFWWTKEEAERDAAMTGLPIVGLGPMSCAAPADQHQGEPYGWAHDNGKEFTTHADYASDLEKEGIAMTPLYTRPAPADRGEVERLRKELEIALSDIKVEQRVSHNLRKHKIDYMEAAEETRKALVDQLAERDALLQEIRGQSGSSWLRGETQHKLDAALSASAEPSAATWSCQPCQLEQPTDRSCDACGGQTVPVAAKS